jgi:hypothetical protein
MSDDIEDIVAMARAAYRDDRLADGALYGKLADEIERLRARVADLEREVDRMRPRSKLAERDRRERIATACLVELVAWRGVAGDADDLSDAAIKFADALIARLDKEAKP